MFAALAATVSATVRVACEDCVTPTEIRRIAKSLPRSSAFPERVPRTA